DVVAQQRDNEVEPVARRDTAFDDVLAAEDLLTDIGDEDRVLDVVIGRVTAGDVFQGDSRAEADDVRILGLEEAVGPDVALLQAFDEGIDHQLGAVEHGPLGAGHRGPQSYSAFSALASSRSRDRASA